MKYTLKKANNSDINLLIRYKLTNIFDYTSEISKEDQKRIIKYVNEHIPKQINEYKIIKINNKGIGSLLVIPYLDGVMLDEIFIEQEYRNKKIGSNIIKQILLNNEIVYLWVYKNNKKAIKLYNKFWFVIKQETDNRYLMKFSKLEKARDFCKRVRLLAQEYNLPFFVVTDGASATSNNGCEAVRVSRENHIKWENENNLSPDEDWDNNK